MGGVYDLYIWHDGTLSNPTSNSDRSLHPWCLCPWRQVSLFSCGLSLTTSGTSLGMLGAFRSVWQWQHQGCCWHWAPIIFKTVIRGGGRGWGDGCPWSLLCQLQFQPLRGQCGDSWQPKLASLGVSFWGGISWMVKSEWLWVGQIHMWMPWASHLYPAFGYDPGDLLPSPPELLRGQQLDRLAYQPKCLPL